MCTFLSAYGCVVIGTHVASSYWVTCANPTRQSYQAGSRPFEPPAYRQCKKAMEIPQLDTTNVLLGIIAGLGVLQAIAAVVAIVWLRRTVSRVSQAAAVFQTQYLRPIVAEAQQVAGQARNAIAELQPLVHRAKTIVNGIEGSTERAMTAVDAVNEQVDAIVHTGLRQVRAIEHGLRRGVEALVNSSYRR